MALLAVALVTIAGGVWFTLKGIWGYGTRENRAKAAHIADEVIELSTKLAKMNREQVRSFGLSS